ncbi:type I secretion protein TolC [Leucothrix sargassi]|nr:type I secretion protein TolC [Leucothrix sargassi]
MIKNISAKVLISVTTCLLASSAAYSEDLFTVYQHAKESDPQIRSSEANYLAVLEQKPQALAAFGSSVTLSGSASIDNSTTYSGASSSTSNALDVGAAYSLDLSKPLYNRVLNEQLAQADITIAQAEQTLIAQKQNLILRVAEAYFNYLTARDAAQLARAEVEAIERQNKQAEIYFEAGRSAITDLKESQAGYDESLASAVEADQNVEIALDNLYSLTNREYKILRGASDATPLVTPTPANIEAWSTSATQNNKDVVVAQLAVDIAQKEVDIARANKKPVVNMFASHDGSISEGESDSDSLSGSASIGVSFSMNLYDSGKSDADIRQARYLFRKAIQDLETSRRSASQQARSYYLNIVTGLNRIKALKRSLESSEVSRKATEEGYRAGTRTAVDVLLAYRDTFQSQNSFAAARNTFLLNTIRLKSAAGTLSEEDLRAMSRILNRSQTTRLAPLSSTK